MSKPLEGIKVLDLTTFVAAPVCARLLADLGAEVIKVEPPKGDAWRITGKSFNTDHFSDEMNPVFDIYNSGKKLISLNLKSEEGREIFFKLMGEADVFVTNNRPDALKRLGIYYDDVKERFPQLIYAIILGYGEKGPEAAVPAFDVTAFWTRSGFLRDMAMTDSEYQPLMPPSGAGDTVTGTTLCVQICAALLNRMRTGKGDFVRSSLYQNGIFTFGSMGLATQLDGGRVYPRPRLAGGSAGAITGTYCCKDGEWLFMANGGSAAFIPRIVAMVGHPELMEDPRLVDKVESNKPENVRAIFEMFKAAFMTKTCDEWIELGKEYDIPLVKMNHFKDVAHDEQAIVNGFVEKVTYENGDSIMIPTCPFIMDSLGPVETKVTHTVGWDTEDVLLDLGYTKEQIAALAESGAVVTRN